MIGGKLLSASAAVEPTYIEDVFSTYLYTGNGSTQTITNGIALTDSVTVTGFSNDTNLESIYATPGTYSWVCPAGVTSVSVVCIGGGAGDAGGNDNSFTGGGLGWKNNIPVTPGNSYTVVVGAGGAVGWQGGANLNNGGDSYFINLSTVKGGGGGGYGSGVPGNFVGDGGGSGGYAGGGSGGSAGGYTGSGGNGRGGAPYVNTAGVGGAAPGNSGTGSGNGTGLYGRGADNGSVGNGAPTNSYGAGRSSTSVNGGAVRIIWGANRTFPYNAGYITTLTEGYGGMVWTKCRSTASTDHILCDTVSPRYRSIRSNTTAGATGSGQTYYPNIDKFLSNGYLLNQPNASDTDSVNGSGRTYASWTFRQAPRFFDVVTYTGNGGTARAISHDLGVTPGMVIVKRTNAAQSWHCLHKDANLMFLDTTDAAFSAATTATRFGDGTNVIRPNSTTFTVTGSTINNSGDTYVAYLFAHDPLGPSGDGSDGLIACGSYTGNGSNTGPVVSLGWEPQWVMIKASSKAGDNWRMFDTMRGMDVNTTGSGDGILSANTTAAEALTNRLSPTATGFQLTDTAGDVNTSGATYTYIAIRRGPMREPTVGTEVFAMDTYRATSPALVSGFVTDWTFRRLKNTTADWTVSSRLTGKTTLLFNSTAAEASGTTELYDYQNGAISSVGSAFSTLAGWMFRRAPGFFDVVAYRGTGSTGTKNHNLGVVPEMMILKNRNDTDGWFVYHQATGNTGYTGLNTTNGFLPAPLAFNNTSPTASVFTVGSSLNFSSSFNYIAYLFASLPGISKVGSYTGNGSNQTINCAFTTGARFILIKRTDSTGDWYVWDSARGIVSGNDPHLSLNTTAAEVTTNDTIDPDSTGFTVNQLAANNVNVNAATYIYLAIA